jgi:hypothetical protein
MNIKWDSPFGYPNRALTCISTNNTQFNITNVNMFKFIAKQLICQFDYILKKYWQLSKK